MTSITGGQKYLTNSFVRLFFVVSFKNRSIIRSNLGEESDRVRQPKKNPLYKSFGYAFEGILTGIRKERNMKIHCLMMGCVSIAGLIFHISRIEWCICLVLFGLILSLELVNTAGAVLVAAIMAAAAGLVIFITKVWEILS